MIEDPELLRRYAEENSQAAFAEIVARRVDLVYSVALRQVGGDAHLAKDVTQKVFTDLARKAGPLSHRAVLTGWLYRSTQYAASDVVRGERRRRTREQTSQAMQEISTPLNSPADWEKLRPLLDDAMIDLSEDDRDAVALRYFEGRAFAEIGRALRLSEEAARKRVDRALDKMAAALSRRGVTSTSAALGLALANQAVGAAPAGLAASVSGAALAGAAATVATAGVAAGFLGFMASSKVGVSLGIIALGALGGAVWQTKALQQTRLTLAAAEQNNAALHTRAVALEQRATAAEEDTAKLLAAVEAERASRTRAVMAAPARSDNTNEPELTHDAVQERFRRAQQLARSGDPAEALAELLWCFDRGMPAISSFTGVRMSFLPSAIAQLGEKYPPALAALRERRDKAAQRLLAGTNDFEAAQTVAALNRYLKDDASTLAVFDQLPAGDPRRGQMAMVAFDQLREARRYADAAEGRNVSQMRQSFEMSIIERPLPPNTSEAIAERLRKSQRDYPITTAANNIEVLAGIGKTDDARALAERVLAFDSSPETHTKLQERVTRAGKPDLLVGIKGW